MERRMNSGVESSVENKINSQVAISTAYTLNHALILAA